MSGVTPALLVPLLVALLPGAICFMIARAGQTRLAWGIAGVAVLLLLGLPALIQVLDTHGQAGLFAVFLILLILLPGAAGALLGAAAGHLARRWGLRPPGDLPPGGGDARP